MCAVPGLFWNVNDITLVGQKNWKRADFVFDLALENEPELT